MTVLSRTPHGGLFLSDKSILSPRVDFWLTSGLSLLVVGAVVGWTLLRGGAEGATEGILGKLVLFQLLINWPHFMISYWLLYSRKDSLRDYPAATLIVPAILVLLGVAAMLPIFGGSGPGSLGLVMSTVIWTFASFYLAWHYTGQCWGMMMSFGHLSGLKLPATERLVLRNGLRVMIGWHVVWALQTLPQLPLIGPLQSQAAMRLFDALAALAFASGAWALTMAARRGGGIDLRVVGAWAVLYLWYVLLAVNPEAFMLVQLSHSLQYLGFPMRVEMNRAGSRRALRAALIYGGSVAGGFLVFYVPEFWLVSATGAPTLLAMLGVFVNIHHYYTDSAIWKLKKPEVRDQLFGHLH